MKQQCSAKADGRPPPVLFLDADNTLWGTDAVYANAQVWLLNAVERALNVDGPTDDRLGYVRRIDQLLASRHHAGLRYPPKLLVNALARSFSGESAERATKLAWTEPQHRLAESEIDELQTSYTSRLRCAPELRSGVLDGLRRLHGLGLFVCVLTEGHIDRVRQTADALGIGSLINRFFEGKKEARFYRRIFKLTRRPDVAFMVGDQLDRDIAPAKAAGLITIYFPGGFAPSWTPSESAVAPHFTIKNFAEAADIIARELHAGRPVKPSPT